MKQIILYYYNIDVVDYEQNDEKGLYFFNYKNEDYVFTFYNRTLNELNEILMVLEELKNKNYGNHAIIYNKFSKPFTLVGENNYILLKLSMNKNSLIDVYDILENNNKFYLVNKNLNIHRNDWANLWSKKIDYLEEQIRLLGKNNKSILDSFSYYVGLGENAITYYNLAKKNSSFDFNFDKITLSHRRIFYPNYMLNYGNPLSFVFDLEIRDIAEYYKAMFFNVSFDDAWSDVSLFIKISNYSKFMYQMFLARMLFPTYYFDVYEKIVNCNDREELLIKIIDKLDDYELFLKKIYILIKEKVDVLEYPNWIIKKL